MNKGTSGSQKINTNGSGSSGLLHSKFFFYVFLSSFALSFLFLIISGIELFNSKFNSFLSEHIYVYFWVFLLYVGRSKMSIPHLYTPLPGIQTFDLVAIIVGLYAVFFVVMILSYFFKGTDKTLSKSPMIFYGAMTSFGLFLSFLVISFEGFAGIPIGGGSITNSVNYLTYVNLIYAPFVEELGYRIIPLGIYAVILVSLYRPFKTDLILAFLAPGFVRRKYGLKLGFAGYALIVITSAAFGYAHVLYGLWDWGKFLQASLVGVILAFGYIEFGVFVDIPMHWFFNGVLTISYIFPQAAALVDVATFWFLFSGIIATVFLVLLAVQKVRKRTRAGVSTSGPP